MSSYVWIGFLMMIGIVAFLYLPLDQAYNNILDVTNTTVTHTGTKQTITYIATIWYFLPIIFLLLFSYWAFSQSQKEVTV